MFKFSPAHYTLVLDIHYSEKVYLFLIIMKTVRTIPSKTVITIGTTTDVAGNLRSPDLVNAGLADFGVFSDSGSSELDVGLPVCCTLVVKISLSGSFDVTAIIGYKESNYMQCFGQFCCDASRTTNCMV